MTITLIGGIIMGIYSTRVPVEESSNEVSLDSLIAPNYRYYENFEEMAFNNILTMEENYNHVMEAIALHELGSLENTKSLAVYTEASIDGFVMAVKKFLLRIWDAISGLFKSFVQFMDKYTKSDKEFVKKYKSKVMAKTLDDKFSFNGYKFTIVENEIKNAIEEASKEPERFQNRNAVGSGNKGYNINKYNQDISTHIEELRGRVLSKFVSGKGKAGKYDLGEFTKELHQALRGGMETKEELDSKDIDTNNMLAELETSKDAKKKANEFLKAGKKSIDEGVKEIERKSNEMSRNFDHKTGSKLVDGDKLGDNNTQRTNSQKYSHQMREISYYLNHMKQSRAIVLQIEGAVLNALKERSRQYKACCIKIVNYKESNESAHLESANFINPFKSIQMK